MILKSAVLILTVFFLNVLLVESLKMGDKGVQVVKMSVTKTKRLPYKKWRQGRYVTYYRTVKYQVTQNQLVCMVGWQHNSQMDVCLPVCNGCLHGLCIAPNTCVCPPPLTFELNDCVPPKCEKHCVNSQCINNTCECFDNMRRFNQTHCANCSEGFVINQDLSCTPICERPCINSFCSTPNGCTCEYGYEPIDRFTCVPVCDECVHGECIAPNTCQCSPGYRTVDNRRCEPECFDCGNGTCVEPYKCDCVKGFENKEGECIPICDVSCVNGKCTGPNQCTCNEGYEESTEAGVCVKICTKLCNGFCDDEGNCVDTQCVNGVLEQIGGNRNHRKAKERYVCCNGYVYDKNTKGCTPQCKYGCIGGTCVRPDVCQCDPPLILYQNECVSPCSHTCVNADCVGNNNCRCFDEYFAVNETHCILQCPDGYTNDPIDCKPICDTPCVNGECTAPNTCTCHPGYDKMNDTDCVPHCDQECVNSKCTAPNTCTCLEGYESKDGVCTPVCDRTCSNGICTEPNKCTCEAGYQLDPEDNFNCQPICEQTCTNGQCTAPNVCECLEGYTKIDETCRPVCNETCINGSCTEPNKCTCNPGYERNPIDQFSCLPICEPKCANASCVSPNTCSCNPGYVAKNEWSCKPDCKDCQNGQCMLPGLCVCDEGYAMIDGKCSPVCAKGCINGYCSSPGVCSCKEDYQISSSNNNTCEPVCRNKCVNSVCVSPNKCKCKEGYKPGTDANVCDPICETCENGVCMEPGKCICRLGFKMSSGKCSPVCKSECINGYCSAPHFCTCNEGYLKNDTSTHICYKPCEDPCDGFCDVDGVCHFNKPVICKDCNGTCTEEECYCADGKKCYLPPEEPQEIGSYTSMAGVGFIAIPIIVLLLVVLIVITLIWNKRRNYDPKKVDQEAPYGSVIYTAPNTLIRPPEERELQEGNYEEINKEPKESHHPLLGEERVAEDEQL